MDHPDPFAISLSPTDHAPRARVVHVDPEHVTPHDLADAGRVIREGGLVAFPTETVYGLGANALDASAVGRIFLAKGRPSFNPLIVHVLDLNGASALAADIPDLARALAAAFWPGPLTLVLRRRAHVPSAVTAGLDTVGVRAPAHPVARALLQAAGVPIAAPSANRYTQLSPTTAAHVEAQLGARIDMIVDGGDADVGIESTVLDVSSATPTLLRPGSIPRSALEAITGTLATLDRDAIRGDAPRPAPGMVERHYAPNAKVVFVDRGDHDGAVRQLQALAPLGRVAVLSYSAGMPAGDVTRVLPSDPAGYAQRLYAALHDVDDAGCAAVVVERVPSGEAWEGIADRLMRAAAPNA